MREIFMTPASFVWLILMLATAGSWYMGGPLSTPLEDHSIKAASITVLLIAFIKVRLVIMHFMEVAHAPRTLKLICDLLLAAVSSLLLILYAYGKPLAEIFAQ